MAVDCWRAWTIPGRGPAVDESKSRIDRGLNADTHWPWTMRGCGRIADAVAVVDMTGPRTDCGLVADTDWP